jgi:hypothetical protein
MKKIEAQAVMQDASQDKRIEAQLSTRYVQASGNGYRVTLVLRKLRVVTIRLPEEWESIKTVWSDL